MKKGKTVWVEVFRRGKTISLNETIITWVGNKRFKTDYLSHRTFTNSGECVFIGYSQNTYRVHFVKPIGVLDITPTKQIH